MSNFSDPSIISAKERRPAAPQPAGAPAHHYNNRPPRQDHQGPPPHHGQGNTMVNNNAANMGTRVPPTNLLAMPPLTTTKNAETGEYHPAVNHATQVLFRTAGDVIAVVPTPAASKLPFYDAAIAANGGELPFKYPLEVLTAIHIWCEKYGTTGVAESPLPTPNKFVEFTLLATAEWDKQFYQRILCGTVHDAAATATGFGGVPPVLPNGAHTQAPSAVGHNAIVMDNAALIIGVINAAEEYKLAGLLEFCIAALGCVLRGKNAADVNKLINGKPAPAAGATPEEIAAAEKAAAAAGVSDADKAAVKKAYPWFEPATKA